MIYLTVPRALPCYPVSMKGTHTMTKENLPARLAATSPATIVALALAADKAGSPDVKAMLLEYLIAREPVSYIINR